MLTKKNAENADFFYCEKCCFKTVRRSNFEKHLLTRKHNLFTFVDKKEQKNASHICVCGKQYKSRQGLYGHKKKCNYKTSENNDTIIINSLANNSDNLEKDKNNDITIDKSNGKNLDCDMYIKVINELKNIVVQQSQQISELIPRIGNTTNNTQKFNINVFLNEKCRDAIDIADFIKSIKISIGELDTIKSKGMAHGLSTAIMTNLENLSVYERPIHCTDIKRETLYIKDHNQWECDHDKSKIKRVIKQMAGKPYAPLQEWIAQNPDFKEIELKQDYVANVLSTIGKSTENDNIDNKIIKNLCNYTYIKS